MVYKATISALALGVMLTSGQALAYQKGDIILRVGAAAVDPREDSSELTLDGIRLTDALGAAVGPATAGVDSNTQLGLSVTYMLSDKIGIEVLAATPFSHTVTANLGAAGVVKAADVKHLPPTVTAQYYFLGKDSAIQPYAGIGLNYTTFFDTDVASELDAVTTGLGLGKAVDLELDDSFGFAFQLGVDVQLADNLILNAAVWKADIDTTATFRYAGGERISTEVGIDPMVYMVGLGYRF